MKGFTATEVPMRLEIFCCRRIFDKFCLHKLLFCLQKSLFCRQEFLRCLQKPRFCLQKSLFCLQKSVFGTSLIRHTARSSAADRLWMRTPGATAGRRTRQTMVEEEVVDPEAAARSTDYLISRSFARRLPSFRYDTCGGGRYLIDLL